VRAREEAYGFGFYGTGLGLSDDERKQFKLRCRPAFTEDELIQNLL
jgi:hypothetical protein